MQDLPHNRRLLSNRPLLQLGTYDVNGEIFQNKISAILHATQTKADISWKWHAPGYESLDWTVDDSWTLQWIYRQRALQLRDTYDWITLSYSGGHDTWNVLHTFLSNNIPLDEVLVRWPLKAAKGQYTPNCKDISAANHASEWDFCIKPDLEWLASHHPDIKITIQDWSDIVDTESDDRTILSGLGDLNPGHAQRWSVYGQLEIKQLDKGKQTCLLTGADKPQLAAKGSRIFCYFLDHLLNSHCHKNDNVDRTTECFYWTDDFPQVTKTQARMIFRCLQNDPKKTQLIQWGQNYDPLQKKIWNDFINTIIYPEYDHSRFQSMKNSAGVSVLLSASTVVPDHDWGILHTTNRMTESWRYHMQSFIDSIDKKYLTYHDQQPRSLINFPSTMYYLGDLEHQELKVLFDK